MHWSSIHLCSFCLAIRNPFCICFHVHGVSSLLATSRLQSAAHLSACSQVPFSIVLWSSSIFPFIFNIDPSDVPDSSRQQLTLFSLNSSASLSTLLFNSKAKSFSFLMSSFFSNLSSICFCAIACVTLKMVRLWYHFVRIPPNKVYLKKKRWTQEHLKTSKHEIYIRRS